NKIKQIPLSNKKISLRCNVFLIPGHLIVKRLKSRSKIKKQKRRITEMKKLVANIFIALAVLGGIPSLGLAGVKNSHETVNGDFANYRIPGNSTQRHQVYLSAGSASIIISGDGGTDLDLYVYDSSGLIDYSESYSD